MWDSDENVLTKRLILSHAKKMLEKEKEIRAEELAYLKDKETVIELLNKFYDREPDGTYKHKKGTYRKVTPPKETENKSIPVEENEGKKKKASNPLKRIMMKIPTWIDTHNIITSTKPERIFRYDHGVYIEAEQFLEDLIEREFFDITTNNLVKDAIGKIKRQTHIDSSEFNASRVLNVKNGLLNLDTLKIEKHSPACISTSQLQWDYNPRADCPRFKKFLSEVAQPQDIPLIQELLGWLLWPDYDIHKAVMLEGQGRNGKGTLLRVTTAFLGKENVSHVMLQSLVADKFAAADLFGKVANIGGDLPDIDLSDTAMFKGLTGSDDARVQHKYSHAFDFRNRAKMWFSANKIPRSKDDSYAFYARWIIISFLNTFKDDPTLEARLTTPEEMSGLLNYALQGLARLKANGWKFSYDKTVEDVELMYKRNANPVFAFLQDECEYSESDYIEKTQFYRRFTEYLKKHGRPKVSITKFGMLLRDQSEFPIADYRPYSDSGAAARCWFGIRFKDKQKKEAEQAKFVDKRANANSVRAAAPG